VWASQYPSNDGKDGRVDLIRLDKDRTGKIIATKLTGAQSLRLRSSWPQQKETVWIPCCFRRESVCACRKSFVRSDSA
jgi:hypothetical protein